MLLTSLRTQEEQEAFLGLAHRVAKADGEFDYASMVLIGMYQEEMGLKQMPALPQQPISSLCRVFSDSDHQQIVFLNLCSLARVDGNHNTAKKDILETIRRELAVSPAEAKRLEGQIELFTASYYPGLID